MLTLKRKNLWAGRMPYVAAGAALSMTLLCHGLWYRPVAERLAGVNDRLAAARGELQIARAAAADLPQVQQAVSELHQKIQSEHRVQQHDDAAQFIRDITASAGASSLSKFTLQPGVSRHREMVSEMPLSISFEGEYLGACNFIRRLEETTHLTSTTVMSMHVVDPQTGRVEVQLSMNLYLADEF